MSTIKAGLLAALIPLALAAPALAQDSRGPGPQMVFSDLDLDGDGALTLEEMQNARQGRFARADADGDGLVTRDELIAQAMTRAGQGVDRMIERADADGDGALSAAELEAMRDDRRSAGMERLFGRVDADGDGSVTEAEFDAAMARMEARRDQRGGDHGERRGHGTGFWRG